MYIKAKNSWLILLACAMCLHRVDAEITDQNKKTENDLGLSSLNTYKSDKLSICVYNNSITYVTDIRKIHLKKGINTIYVYNISPKLDIKSVTIKTVKQVLSYELLNRSSSQNSVFKTSVGSNVRFKNGKDKIVGVLKNIFFDKERNKQFAIINQENEAYIIPVEDCLSVFSTNISTKKDALKINIMSDTDIEEDIVLGYITQDITWQPEYSISMNNQMTTAVIDTKAALANNTEWDLKDVDLRLDYSTPEMNKLAEYKIDSSRSFVYPTKLSLKHSSSAVVPINTINNAKLTHNYYIKISENLSGNMPLAVHNLISFEMGNLNIKTNSNALLYLANGNEKRFLGQQGTKSIEGLNEVAFLVGVTNDISASVRYVDTRNITDKISEVSVAIVVKNNKPINVNAYISTSVNGEYNILKESDNRVSTKSLLWNVSIDANSTKELYYKLRISKK